MSPHGINEQEEGTKIIKAQKKSKKEKRTWMIVILCYFLLAAFGPKESQRSEDKRIRAGNDSVNITERQTAGEHRE